MLSTKPSAIPVIWGLHTCVEWIEAQGTCNSIGIVGDLDATVVRQKRQLVIRWNGLYRAKALFHGNLSNRLRPDHAY